MVRGAASRGAPSPSSPEAPALGSSGGKEGGASCGAPDVSRMLFWRPSSGPLALNCRRHPHYVKILHKGRTALYAGRGDFTDVGAVQAESPAATACAVYYFEVEVVACSASPRICVGLSTKGSALTKHPGVDPHSVGYRAEDGRKLVGSATGSSLSRGGSLPGEAFSSPYGQGDVVGCGIHHASRKIFFTKNGVCLGVAAKAEPAVEYFPSAGMQGAGEQLRFNFTGPFVFDLRGMLQCEMLEERQRIKAELGHPSLAPALTEVVRSYLLHAAFSRTLAAFEKALAAEQPPETATAADAQGPARATGSAEEALQRPAQSAEGERERRDAGDDETRREDAREESPGEAGGEETMGAESREEEVKSGESSEGSMSSAARRPLSITLVRPSSPSSASAGAAAGLAVAFARPEDEGSPCPDITMQDDDKSEREAMYLYPTPHRDFRTKPETSAILLASLPKRTELKQAIVSGRADVAAEILDRHFPAVVALPQSAQLEDESFALALLYTQQLIEFLRPPARDVRAAVAWMKAKLAPLTRDSPPHIRQAITECCGLLAFQEPERSSLAAFFDLNRRTVVATAINRCVLRHHFRIPCWSSLEVLVRHLVACRQLLREFCGNRGPIPSSSLFCYPPPMRRLLQPSSPSRALAAPPRPLISTAYGEEELLELPLIYSP
ncbi:SPRY domain-containing protein [Besnoitia besnoiti]|uniref:SPRY domain-containing protein n=1 Tax=Besnoitia besnoiti TaxID=94643 RepID=A0A2A9MR26_BESBE|nr:SPRY domain-containing protein [Besnoitia besnoiti]PFH38790.1 SPRY domain-containing protein [Besnoitia besnoiti]